MDLMEAFDRCLRQWKMHIEENNCDDLETLAKSGDCLEAEMCIECFDVYNRKTSEQQGNPKNSTPSAEQQLKDAISTALPLLKKVAPYNGESHIDLNNAIAALETATV